MMLISPEAHRRFNLWMATRTGRARLGLEGERPKKKLELPYRAAGLIILLGLTTFVWVLINTSMRAHGLANPSPREPTEPRVGWLPFVAGFAGIVGGVYVVKKPEVLYRWSAKATPRLRTEEPLEATRMKRAGLLMGLCLIGFGLFAIATGLVKLFH